MAQTHTDTLLTLAANDAADIHVVSLDGYGRHQQYIGGRDHASFMTGDLSWFRVVGPKLFVTRHFDGHIDLWRLD